MQHDCETREEAFGALVSSEHQKLRRSTRAAACFTRMHEDPDSPWPGGVRHTAWARAASTLCSASPIRSFPAKDLPITSQPSVT